MNYVEVLVANSSYHGNEPLTYTSAEPLQPGQIVTVPLRAKEALGVVLRPVQEPSFAAKEILGAAHIPPLPPQLISTMLWMHTYYPSSLGNVAQQFLPKRLPLSHGAPKGVTEPYQLEKLPPLTTDQQQVLNAVTGSGLYLLHGDTGTGKTRVYIELAKEQLAKGKSAIILTPEIGLTSQLAHDFRAIFGDKVVIIHSQLSEATRRKLWVQLLQQTTPLIVIGPRSALFSPLRHVGLIIVDESHENAYKQDQAPHYHATMVASTLGNFHRAVVILGSATPLVSDYYVARAKQRPILRMEQIATVGNHESTVEVVDLRDKNSFSRNPYLSDPLIAAIQATLQRHEQVLLFLNRRGTARVVFCERCGWQAACPHCDLPLVYHGDQHQMRCHTCTFKAVPPGSCPDCHNPSVVFRSIGTKAIAEEVRSLFPEAIIQRFDTDNKKDERIEQHYDTVRDGNVDILVGTQTLAKGLDLPHLGLVGVIIADTSLYFPDFSASERTYQLLRQVLGRIGRGHRRDFVVVQTYTPDSPLLQAALHKNWDAFYDQELAERKTFLFPPFCYLLKLSCRRSSRPSAQKTAETLAHELKRRGRPIVVEGPAPAFHEKVQNKYQWQLVIKSKRRQELLDIVASLPSGWSYDIDPTNLL